MTPVLGSMRRWQDLGKPSRAAGNAVLALGVISLVPLVAPLAAALASLVSLAGVFVSGKYPERFAGRRRIIVGLCLCALGMGLFFIEADLFLRWKTRQAYEERLAISRFRLAEISEGLERYREKNGAYPAVSGIMTLREILQPGFAPECPAEDAFGHAFSAVSEPGGYALTFTPEPPPYSPDAMPEPVVVRGAFQPAPEPAPAQPEVEEQKGPDELSPPPATSKNERSPPPRPQETPPPEKARPEP